MPVKKKGLGRGLDVMFPQTNMGAAKEAEADATSSEEYKKVVKALEEEQQKTRKLQESYDRLSQTAEELREKAKQAAVMVDIKKIEPNRNQPRKRFDEESLESMAESVRIHGVVFPIMVQDRGDHYEIIAGERRWRASMMAGLSEMPVIITDKSEQEIVEISIIENVQREDLNAIEEAMAYKRLMTEFSMNQEKVAERVGKSRSAVANSLRLLNLEEEIQMMLIEGEITSGHARALLTLEDSDKRLFVARRIVEDKLTVRDIEKLVKNPDKLIKHKTKIPAPDVRDLIYRDMEKNLREKLSARVSINVKNEGKGRIEIEFFSRDELDCLIDLLLTVNREG